MSCQADFLWSLVAVMISCVVIARTPAPRWVSMKELALSATICEGLMGGGAIALETGGVVGCCCNILILS